MGFSSARNLGRDISAGFSPPRRMPISEAVKKFMRVPKGAGNSVPWDPELTPYIIEPMNCLASREYDAVIFVGPARTGKTIGLIDGWIVYTIVCDPSDMLVVQMTEDKAREHSKKRLDRTFRSSAAVKKRMSPRRNDNNVHDKTFRDGSFLKIGWPSVNIMSSSDYRFVALTDYDRFPENIDSEGDGFSLASKRTTTFMSAGMTLVESSPGRDICDSKWRRKSPHEAPPTTGILGFDLSSLSLNANGGIYQSADLSRYSGTVVNRPTFFAFAKGAGVMGEAGPEAILPLRRGADGKLGVVADIGGSGMAMFAPQYNIEINNDGTNGQIGPAALKVVYDLGKKAAADFMQQQARDGGRLSGAYR